MVASPFVSLRYDEIDPDLDETCVTWKCRSITTFLTT